jgi:PDZ domain
MVRIVMAVIRISLTVVIATVVMASAIFSGVVPGGVVRAQSASGDAAPESVTVPFTLDQGRIVIDVDLLRRDGSTERVRGWVDNGTPDLYMNQRVAELMGLTVSCDGQVCRATPESPKVTREIAIHGMKIPLPAAEEIEIPASPAVGPGMSAEINIPSTILRNYDVMVNFPDREFSIGLPGTLKFKGVTSKMLVNVNNGLIQVPSRIESKNIDNKHLDLGLDLGSSINFLSDDLFGKLASAHPDWPRLTGAIGPFNTGGWEEPKWKLMRVERVQFGPLFLTDVAIANFPSRNANRPAFAGAGVISSEALMNYRVGLDYAHATVYFDIGRTVKLPDFDVVGLILRPEGDNGFSIAGVADFEGSPSVVGVEVGDRLVAVDGNPVAELTLGEVWSLLEGSPEQERKLTLARAGKQFTVVAKAQHFLGGMENGEVKGKAKRR